MFVRKRGGFFFYFFLFICFHFCLYYDGIFKKKVGVLLRFFLREFFEKKSYFGWWGECGWDFFDFSRALCYFWGKIGAMRTLGSGLYVVFCGRWGHPTSFSCN